MRKTCKQPDRDVPALICGYPIPCPHHTLVIDGERVRVPPRGSALGAVRARSIAKALK